MLLKKSEKMLDTTKLEKGMHLIYSVNYPNRKICFNCFKNLFAPRNGIGATLQNHSYRTFYVFS